MTRSFSRIFALPILTAAIAVSAPIAGQTQGFKSAKSGRYQKIDAYYGWNNDCSHKLIDVQIVQKPKNGSVEPRVVTERIRSDAAIGTSGKCAGKRTKAVAVYYKSKSGYRGIDSFRVRMSVGGQSKYFNYTVRVN